MVQRPARWTRPLVRVDAVWTKIETWMVLAMLLLAIFYMAGWVTLSAFHTKGGKLARFPGIIATFAGVSASISWGVKKDRRARGVIVPVAVTLFGAVLLIVSRRQDYFANVSRWLSDASVIKLMGTPQIVSARLFTIWVALLGASLATGSGRQINIDVVMRFIGPRTRLVTALAGYVVTAAACFVISWGFLDYLAITRFGASKDLPAGEKLAVIARGSSRHLFLLRRQLALDARSCVHVVLKGEPFDKWYTGAEWNREVNENGWASVYPPPSGAPASAPCLTPQEVEEFTARNGVTNSDWRLPGVCDLSNGGATRAPLATAPEPDDRTPLEADLSLLFPWGFFVIGCRFLLRAALAAGGSVSTDPNAAHAVDSGHPIADPLVAVHPPIAERRVDEEARAHEGEQALPRDDISIDDVGDPKEKGQR